MDNKDIAKEWFEFAKRDLESALFLLKMYPLPLEIICYHCQQSAEKYLKGYIILQGGKPIKTHDLIMLNNMCCKHDMSFVDIEDDCVDLVSYGVQVRYPYEMMIEERDMKEAIESAKRIMAFIEQRVN